VLTFGLAGPIDDPTPELERIFTADEPIQPSGSAGHGMMTEAEYNAAIAAAAGEIRRDYSTRR
jgi:hypothetical protein